MRKALILLVTLTALTACSSTTDAATAAPDTSAAASPSETAVDPTAFVAQFRQAYPDLAEGREDNGIANDGDRICDYLAEDGMTRQTYTTRLSAAFERNGITPTADDVLAMAQIGVTTLCPEQQQTLTALP